MAINEVQEDQRYLFSQSRCSCIQVKSKAARSGSCALGLFRDSAASGSAATLSTSFSVVPNSSATILHVVSWLVQGSMRG